MNYEELENDVVSLLSTAFSSTHIVEHIPESESDFEKEVRKTRIMVGYAGSDFGSSKSIADVVQDEEVELILQIESRLLRGENNIYDTLEKCRKLLVNFRSTTGNTLRFIVKSQKLVGVKNQIKQWHQTFKCTAVVVTDEEEQGSELEGYTLPSSLRLDQVQFTTSSV